MNQGYQPNTNKNTKKSSTLFSINLLIIVICIFIYKQLSVPNLLLKVEINLVLIDLFNKTNKKSLTEEFY